MPVDFENRAPEASSIAKQVHEFMDDIDRGTLSILSPKVMSLLPSDGSQSSPNRLLSPNILSFHNEGVLPLPRLLGVSSHISPFNRLRNDRLAGFLGQMRDAEVDRFPDGTVRRHE